MLDLQPRRMSGIRSTICSLVGFLYIFQCIISLSVFISEAASVSHFFVYGVSVLQSAIDPILRFIYLFSNITIPDSFSFLLVLLFLNNQYALGSTNGSPMGSVRQQPHWRLWNRAHDKFEYPKKHLHQHSHLPSRTVYRRCPSIGQPPYSSASIDCNRANELTFPHFSWFKVCGDPHHSMSHYPRIRVCGEVS